MAEIVIVLLCTGGFIIVAGFTITHHYFWVRRHG